MKFSIFSINDGKRTGLVSNSSNPPSRASCLCSAIAFELDNMKTLENWDGAFSKLSTAPTHLEKLFSDIDKDKS